MARNLTTLTLRSAFGMLKFRGFQTSALRQDIFTVQDEKDFKDKVINATKPVVVEFHATWCQPCKILMPRMEKAIEFFDDKVDMAKVDIDDMSDIAMQYDVSVVPTVVVFKGGKPGDRFMGVKDIDEIDTFINNAQK